MGLGQVSTVDVPTRWSCASSKTSWQTGSCVLARCLGEEPMSRSSTFQVFSPVHEGLSEPLVVDLVNGLNFRHPVHVNNPSDVKKKNNHHCFKFGFALPCFLLSWWTGALTVHGLALTFWVVLKKTMIHHKLRSLKSLGSFKCFEECQHKCSFEFPFVQDWGVSAPSSNTLFFIVFKRLCKICRTAPLSTLINQQLLECSGDDFVEQFHRLFRC